MTKKTRDLILKTASEAFLRDGYNIGIERIAEEAGLTRQTIYNLFKSKAGLFRAVVAGMVTVIKPKDMLDFSREGDPRNGLTAFGESYLKVMMDDRTLQLHRVLVSQVSQEPDLMLEVFDKTGGLLKARLISYFQLRTKQGLLNVSDADVAAEHFLGLLGGQGQRATYGLGGETEEQQKRRVDAAVGAFLRAYGPAGTSSHGA